ncbi:MAG: bifunctional 5,10-methylenetetrahydrofolate dehydrogenase/5,10-methenyltetrahydrofolate cyclohydrolase [Clostridia bacterium]|nr:bifunctional 5,10-methylenetetrahydrofolate dehydrogenase/5,10-methenyltetrahydrofolate cyclohydrolase [Clostridia bacterium]
MTRALLLDGRAAAARVHRRLRERLGERARRGLRPPVLGIVWVGEDEATAAYIRAKRRAASRLGVEVRLRRLDGQASAADIAAAVRLLSADESVDGVLVQSPLPRHVDYEAIVQLIDPAKDVDGFHPINAGRLFRGRPGLVPCTAAGILELLRYHASLRAGRPGGGGGPTPRGGRPTAALLEQHHATVTVCHSRTADLSRFTRLADILVVAAGRPALIGPDMVRPGAVVVDVGIHRAENGLCGDVHPDVAEVAGALSPVPGGVGPMTVAMLMQNLVEAAERRAVEAEDASWAR